MIHLYANTCVIKTGNASYINFKMILNRIIKNNPMQLQKNEEKY